MALYHWTGRIKQAQTINGSNITTVDYEYDTEGTRFIKRTDLGGIVTEIHDLSSDYRVYADGSSEVHTIEIRNGNDPVARFRFQDNHHNSGVWAPSSLFSHRLGADLLRIASLEGGITKLPSLFGFAFTDAYYAVKLLPQIQNREKLLVLLYWMLASIVALAALVLLMRAWRRNPDEGPGLLPVGVYRFGSVLALLSFSATGCIVVPQTQDGSEYLLAANGLFRSGAEGGESNIMSVLGAFYFISTHNGSTDIVTNADGAPVARFVYEPFGKVNSDLTDLDPDRNGVHYGETFMFTGQEFEPETGLYNYKARIYDPETGRFLQPDPKHSERAGFDNWDRYQYANNNPVSFTDPTGMSWLSKQLGGNWLQRATYLSSARLSAVDRLYRIPRGAERLTMLPDSVKRMGFLRSERFKSNTIHEMTYISSTRLSAVDRLYRIPRGAERLSMLPDSVQRMGYVSSQRMHDFEIGFKNAVAVTAVIAGSALLCFAFCAPLAGASLGAAMASIGASLLWGTVFGASFGYLLGGFGTSSLNNIHWDEESARAGAFLGGALGLITAIGVMSFQTILPVFAKIMGASVVGELTIGHLFSAGGFFYSLSREDMNGAAYGFLGAFFFPWLLPAILALPFNAAFDEYNRRL